MKTDVLEQMVSLFNTEIKRLLFPLIELIKNVESIISQQKDKKRLNEDIYSLCMKFFVDHSVMYSEKMIKSLIEVISEMVYSSESVDLRVYELKSILQLRFTIVVIKKRLDQIQDNLIKIYDEIEKELLDKVKISNQKIIWFETLLEQKEGLEQQLKADLKELAKCEQISRFTTSIFGGNVNNIRALKKFILTFLEVQIQAIPGETNRIELAIKFEELKENIN